MPELYRLMMNTRSLAPEIMDEPGASPAVTRAFHRDLNRIHRFMGNWRTLAERLRGVNSVIDIGCGDGALLVYLRDHAGIKQVTGIDLKPPDCAAPGITLIEADATCDALPRADAAVAVMLLHHLTDAQVVALIRNVGRSCDRLICIDPVRHWLPMALYTVFLCPMLSRVGALDGRQSIRRSFRDHELSALVEQATAGTDATFTIWQSPVYASLILDVKWR
jgi:SAM-dependent methyltransferase